MSAGQLGATEKRQTEVTAVSDVLDCSCYFGLDADADNNQDCIYGHGHCIKESCSWSISTADTGTAEETNLKPVSMLPENSRKGISGWLTVYYPLVTT